MKPSTKAKLLMMAGGAVTLAPAVFASPAIENDTLEGLPSVGSDLGSFLTNLAPGVGTFVLILGLFLGIVAIVYGIAMLIGKAVGRVGHHK